MLADAIDNAKRSTPGTGHIRADFSVAILCESRAETADDPAKGAAARTLNLGDLRPRRRGMGYPEGISRSP